MARSSREAQGGLRRAVGIIQGSSQKVTTGGRPGRSPRDPIEEGPEAKAARRVQRGDVGDPAGEVGAEVVVTGAVLAVRAVPDAVVEGGLERVIRLPGDVRAGVDHDPGDP